MPATISKNKSGGFTVKTPKDPVHLNERNLAGVLSGLLREVDPSIDPSHIAHLPSMENEQLE